MLVVADVHLGKVNHFRKNGIAVPSRADDRNVEILVTLIELARPERVLFLGDLFHSRFNFGWEAMKQITGYFNQISFELVLGNHDILANIHYEQSGIKVQRSGITEPPFIFTHHPLDDVPPACYNIAGHVHPGVVLRSKGKQGVKIPCFYFSGHQAICPAFGVFTGLCAVQPRKTDRIFAVVNNEVIEVTVK